MKDLPNRLEIKAGVMEMGEKIAWGSDTSLMREAATEIRCLRSENAMLKGELLVFCKKYMEILNESHK